MLLALESIRTDGGTQARAHIDDANVDRYAGAMRDGAMFPPVVVFFDGADNWLADGFHRFWATQLIEGKSIEADVRKGSKWDAVLFAVGANAAHDKNGLFRTNADKRRSVEILLESGRCDDWSDTKVASQCGVSVPLASKVRSELASSASINGLKIPNTRKVTRNGKTYEMDTSGIGRKPTTEDPSGSPAEEQPSPKPKPRKEPKPGELRPRAGLLFADVAIAKLSEIADDDLERAEAFAKVKGWIIAHE